MRTKKNLSSHEALRPTEKGGCREGCVGLVGLMVVQGNWLGATESVSPQVRQDTAKPAKTAARRCEMGAVVKGGNQHEKGKASGRPRGQGGVAGKGPGMGVC